MTILCGAVLAGSLLAGCGGQENAGDGGKATVPEGRKETAGETDPAAVDSDIYTVRVWSYGESNSDELAKVSAAVSEITREKIGVEVELYRTIDTEKLNLALTSGEKMDLVCIYGLAASTLVSTGRLMELDELYTEYAKDAAALVKEEDMAANRVDGKLYYLPTNNDNARSSGFCMRRDIVDELGVDISSIHSMEDMHDVLVQVKQAYPDIYPLVPTWANGGMQGVFHMDDFCSGLAVLADATTDDTTVTSLYETSEWQDFVRTMYQWQQEGLIMPDATTTTDNNPIATVGFASYENIKPGKALENYKMYGKEVVFAQLVPAIKNTDMVKGCWSIAAGCERPDKAMQLWNLMYTDTEIANLFTNGIEGEHYVYTDETNTFLKLPEGVTDTGYSVLDWVWPNCTVTSVWEGAESDLWAQLNAFNDSAAASPALGFTLDTTPVINEITACQNVQQKYVSSLQWGILDPEEAILQFMSELEAAGLKTIQQEAQKQLDAWLSEQ